MLLFYARLYAISPRCATRRCSRPGKIRFPLLRSLLEWAYFATVWWRDASVAYGKSLRFHPTRSRSILSGELTIIRTAPVECERGAGVGKTASRKRLDHCHRFSTLRFECGDWSASFSVACMQLSEPNAITFGTKCADRAAVTAQTVACTPQTR